MGDARLLLAWIVAANWLGGFADGDPSGAPRTLRAVQGSGGQFVRLPDADHVCPHRPVRAALAGDDFNDLCLEPALWIGLNLLLYLSTRIITCMPYGL